jgi:hypothetical protein
MGVGVVGTGGRHLGQAGVQVGVAQLLEVLAQEADGAQRRQALLGVVTVQRQMLVDQRFQQGMGIGGQGALVLEQVAQRAGLVQDPGVHGRDELVAVDEVHLERQDAEQQVAVGAGLRRGVGHRRPPRRGATPGRRSVRARSGVGDFPATVTAPRGTRNPVLLAFSRNWWWTGDPDGTPSLGLAARHAFPCRSKEGTQKGLDRRPHGLARRRVTCAACHVRRGRRARPPRALNGTGLTGVHGMLTQDPMGSRAKKSASRAGLPQRLRSSLAMVDDRDSADILSVWRPKTQHASNGGSTPSPLAKRCPVEWSNACATTPARRASGGMARSLAGPIFRTLTEVHYVLRGDYIYVTGPN